QSFSITVLTYRSMSIADVYAVEGNSGTKTANFAVTISAPVPNGVTVGVNAATANGTATAGSDFTTVSTSLTWNPGDPLTKTLAVPVVGDTRKEGNETFTVNLSSPFNAVLVDASATGTIIYDDGLFYLSAADTAVVEGNSGTISARFKVT